MMQQFTSLTEHNLRDCMKGFKYLIYYMHSTNFIFHRLRLQILAGETLDSYLLLFHCGGYWFRLILKYIYCYFLGQTADGFIDFLVTALISAVSCAV